MREKVKIKGDLEAVLLQFIKNYNETLKIIDKRLDKIEKQLMKHQCPICGKVPDRYSESVLYYCTKCKITYDATGWISR